MTWRPLNHHFELFFLPTTGRTKKSENPQGSGSQDELWPNQFKVRGDQQDQGATQTAARAAKRPVQGSVWDRLLSLQKRMCWCSKVSEREMQSEDCLLPRWYACETESWCSEEMANRGGSDCLCDHCIWDGNRQSRRGKSSLFLAVAVCLLSFSSVSLIYFSAAFCYTQHIVKSDRKLLPRIRESRKGRASSAVHLLVPEERF